MTERVACRSPDCERTILPTTAADTGGYCMPCVQKKAREEREEYIRKNRKDVDPYVGVEDPVEVLKIFHRPVESDPLIRYAPCPKNLEDLYLELDAEQAAEMARHAVSFLEEGRLPEAERIAGGLVAWTPHDRGVVQRAFLAAEAFYPGFLFLEARADVRDGLARRLLALPPGPDHRLQRNHLLTALAWVGDEEVVRIFDGFRSSTPAWAHTLFVAPELYAQQAGWELTKDGERRDLFERTCYPLISHAKAGPDAKVIAMTERSDRCPWCDRKLCNLLELSRVCFLLCESCCCYGRILGDASVPGSRWSSHNERPGSLRKDGSWDGYPRGSLVASDRSRSPWHAPFFLDTRYSQIGGHPTWVQDAVYPGCPGCDRLMPFVGQVSGADLDGWGDGLYYAFECVECRVTACDYQQT